MQAGLSDDFKETVRTRTDLVALIGESVALQSARGGREYIGLCPFHDDHNPSMIVSPERQRYKCWSCGAGGDCFSYVMEREGVGFREALEMLAERVQLEIPRSQRRRSSQSENGDGPSKRDLFGVLAWVERTLHRTLKTPEGRRALNYLVGRGFDEAIIDRFAVGCHPGGRQWLQNQARDLFSPKLLLAAGVVAANQNGSGFSDHYAIRDRVVFPIRDERGRTVAFGGRVLPGEDGPKYINGSDTPLFHKSRLLFGFDLAKDAMRTSGTALVVEGYTDCTACHQHGLENAVAALGTALTEQHVGLLKRFARRVVLVLDGDKAGQGAAERSLSQFLSKEVDLRVLALPGGADPAELLGREGADAFRERIESAPEAWEYKLQACVNRFGLESIDARHRVLDEMLDLLSQAEGLTGTSREDIALSRLSTRLMLDERTVRRRLSEGRSQRRERTRRLPTSNEEQRLRVDFFEGEPDRNDRMECEILEIVFADPESFGTIASELGPDDFRNEYTRRLFEICRDLHEAGLAPSYERLTATIEDGELKRLAAMLDEWSQEKDVSSKLRPDTSTEARAERPRFLDLAVDNLKWRRQERSHELSKGQMAQRSEAAAALNDDVRALLERATDFHGRRVRKNASNDPGR